tara:strand:+ start:91 stop:621 length:531 start_codon:yes stop_codon:yes gene_type:complete
MSCRFSISTCALLLGLVLSPSSSFAQSQSKPSYRVLAREEGGFNVYAVDRLLRKGDKSASKGNYSEAKEHYDKARKVSRQLLSFYRDLSGSFRGLDARIPREMDKKGRETQLALAKVNLRLAALFRKQNQPEIAVPILIEVVRIMTPTHPEGQKAYQALVELGFVETAYRGARKKP